MFRYLFTSFALVLLISSSSCGQKTDTQSGGSTDAQKAAQAAPVTSNVNLYEGLFITGPGSQAFIDCRSGDTYWLEAEKGNLTQRYPMLAAKPYEPTYARLSARPAKLSKLADSLGYKKQLEVVAVAQVNNKPQAECFETELTVRGSKPNWGLQVLTNKTVLFKSPFLSTYAVYSYAAPTTKGDSTFYAFSGAKGEKMTVKLYSQLFIDPVSKKTYKLTADVKVGTAIYRGGAEKPTADQAAAKAAQKAAMEDRAARQKAAAEQKKK